VPGPRHARRDVSRRASADLSLHILRSDYGADIANTVARLMVAPPYRRGGQAAD